MDQEVRFDSQTDSARRGYVGNVAPRLVDSGIESVRRRCVIRGAVRPDRVGSFAE